jgi:hypothetical protein
MQILQTKAECEFGLDKIKEHEMIIGFTERRPNPLFNRNSFDEQMAKRKVLIGC